MRWLAALAFILFTAGCNELAPENKPGGENNPYPTITLPDSGTVEQPANGETRIYNVVVQLSRAAPAAGSFRLQTANGSAEAGKHFEALDARFEFDEGQRQVAVPVTILHDATQYGEQRELDFSVLLVSAQNAELGDANEHLVTVTPIERDPETLGRFSMPGEVVLRAPTEQRVSISYPLLLTLEEPLTHPARVEIRTVPNTAQDTVNYTPFDREFTLAAGDTELALFVELLHDPLQQENLSFEILLMKGWGIDLGSNRSISVTIANSNGDLTPATLNLPQFTHLYEPASGSKRYDMVFPFSHVARQAGSVRFRSQDGSAVAGTHFDAVDSVVQFSAGESQLSVPVTLHHDGHSTGELNFRLQILNPVGLALPDQREFEVTIEDADAEDSMAARPGLQSPANVSLGRPPVGTSSREATIIIPFTEAAPASGSFRVQTRDGSAKSGNHYSAFNRVMTFNSGATDIEVRLELLNNWPDDEDPVEFDLLFSEGNGIDLPEVRSLIVEIQP